jgi:hypothetical protein
MKKRICPICDQVMTLPHYCETCRSFVKNPWIRDVTYYLNERHPEDESGCSYHGGLELDTGRDNIWDIISAKQAVQKRMAERMDRREQPQPNVARQAKEKRQPQPNVPRRDMEKQTHKITGTKIVLVVLVVYLIFQAAFVGIQIVSDSLWDTFAPTWEYEVDDHV